MPVVLNADDFSALQGIAQWLMQKTGIYYSDSKLETLKHKLFKVCLDNRLTLSQLCTQLYNGDGQKTPLSLQVVAAASTNYTAFFREDIWDWFRYEILSDVMSRTQQIRIWSAAVSSGEEAYTIAMVAAECMGIEQLMQRVAILGTDISFQTLRQAEDAIYPIDKLSNIPLDYKDKYFSLCNNQSHCMVVHKALRSICLFRRMNLKKRPYPFKRRFHIIFCRNVLYYFTPIERERIVNALYDFTENNGWLIVSVTESLTSMNTRWKKIKGKTGIYRKE